MAEPDWFMNMINWWIGGMIITIWMYIGQVCSLFTLWDIGHGGVMDTVEQWKMPGVSDTYKGDMKLGV